MALAAHLPKHAKWLIGPIAVVVTAVINALVRLSVEDTAKESHVNFSVFGAFLSASGWLASHWIGVLGWMLAVSLIAMIIMSARDAKRERPVRELESTYQRLLFVRTIVTSPTSTLDDIKGCQCKLNELRGHLLNLTGTVFTQAMVEAFRGPAMFSVLAARTELAGLQFVSERENILAQIDLLLDAIHNKWGECIS